MCCLCYMYEAGYVSHLSVFLYLHYYLYQVTLVLAFISPSVSLLLSRKFKYFLKFSLQINLKKKVKNILKKCFEE